MISPEEQRRFRENAAFYKTKEPELLENHWKKFVAVVSPGRILYGKDSETVSRNLDKLGLRSSSVVAMRVFTVEEDYRRKLKARDECIDIKAPYWPF